MKVTHTAISDITLIEPTVWHDERGFFFESFNHKNFQAAIGRPVVFVQDNHSRSYQHVLRGLHYQLPPFAQAKLVRVVQGEIFDVTVDIRKSSPTFGKWVGTILSAKTNCQLWIPEGFAHGFITLSETAEVLYKTTQYYAPQAEHCIIWNDPDLAIDWPQKSEPILSSKDKQGLFLSQAACFA